MDFSHELTFNQAYRQHLHDHPAIRKAHCLRAQFPGLFDPINPGNRFAGRIHYRLVGFGLELASGGPGYFSYAKQIQPHLEGLSPQAALAVKEMLAFWKSETTIEGKFYPMLPAEVMDATSNSIAEMGGRLSGTVLDFDLLVQLGLPGLRQKVQSAQSLPGHSSIHPPNHSLPQCSWHSTFWRRSWGFSARFVDLEPAVQADLIQRTLHE